MSKVITYKCDRCGSTETHSFNESAVIVTKRLTFTMTTDASGVPDKQIFQVADLCHGCMSAFEKSAKHAIDNFLKGNN